MTETVEHAVPVVKAFGKILSVLVLVLLFLAMFTLGSAVSMLFQRHVLHVEPACTRAHPCAVKRVAG